MEPETVRIPVVRPVKAKSDDAAGQRRHPARVVMRWLGALLLVAVVGAAVAVTVVPALAGATPLTVLSGSMEPTLPVGSTVVVRPAPADRLAVGDIITFTDRQPGTTETRIVTHRIIEVLPGPSFRTQGDANDAPDPHAVAAADVRGGYWYDVPFVGLVKDRLFSTTGLLYLAGIVLLVVAANLLLPHTTGGKSASSLDRKSHTRAR
ncbi:signal peptidase I [Pseudonocardia halophobica]|uniref:signal peptidase I n=1 Tax=Pseudonocardia halophobica TaxID=29401 RepID=UPI003D934730